VALRADQFQQFSAGDLLVLRDIHAMEATGQAEWSTPIKTVRRWRCQGGQLRYTLAEIAYEDARLALIIKEVGDAADLVVGRVWSEYVASTPDTSVLNLWTPNGRHIDFSPTMRVQIENEAVDYDRLPNFPFWDAQLEGTTDEPSAICEYRATKAEPSAWNRNALVEYSPLGGLTTLWLGWDINPRDVDMLDQR